MRTVYKVLQVSLVVAVFILSRVDVSSAHDNEDHSSDNTAQSSQSTTSTANSNESYSFVTPEGGSLSVLARRAVQLYDLTDTSLNLSPAQATFVEAKLVSELGNRYLEIGEKISITKSRVAALAKESLSLDAGSIAAWQAYADTVDFNVSNIADQNAQAATPSSAANNDKADDQKKDDAEHSESEKADANESSSLPSWGVLAAIAAIGAAVYFLNPSRKAQAPAKTEAQPARRSSRQASSSKRKK